MKRISVLAMMCVMAAMNVATAETIRGIDIEFVTIGNVFNVADTRLMTDGTSGYGSVSYNYRIGKYEVTNAQWNAFVASVGAPTGGSQSALFTGPQQPTNRVNWYEAAQFCNYLTSGDKSKGVYQFSGNNTNPGEFLGINRGAAYAAYGTLYCLPNEDEWYKAAYYKPDNSGYSEHTSGTSTRPTPANYGNIGGQPWDVGTGIMEQNGTFDMTGNVWEWCDARTNSVGFRCMRGCAFSSSVQDFVNFGSGFRNNYYADAEGGEIGFRIFSTIPEPASVTVSTDTFGTGANQFTIDFVLISGSTNPDSGYGIVANDYRMGTYEITNDQWNKFKAAYGTVTGWPSTAYDRDPYWTGTNVPTDSTSWYEAAQFVNWLNTSKNYQPAYKFTGEIHTSSYTLDVWDTGDADGTNLFRNKNAKYFLPTEDEWVKAAYWNGSSLQTWATIGDVSPTQGNGTSGTGWNYDYYTLPQPWNVGSGSQELNGTYDMMGNVWEWMESPHYSGDYLPRSNRGLRGGSFIYGDYYLASSGRNGAGPVEENYGGLGFRVASVPETDTLLLYAPNGSESIIAGTIYTISWSSMGSISNVLIEYSTNNGQDWNAVSPPNIGNAGSYGWSVPMIDSQECLIRISDAANSSVSDISDNVFEIVIPKTISISSPNGGESLISGAEQLIQWSSTGAISGVLIEQSFNNGLNWFPVEPANDGNSGSYEWFVPFANSNECLVRISDASNPALYDISDNLFTISQENPSEYPTLYEILGGSAPAIIESGRDFVTRSIPDANVVAFILLESAGFANENILGIYSAYDPQQKLQLFSGSDSPEDMAIVEFDSIAGTARNLQTGQTANIEGFFGFYLTTPQNGGTTYYTDSTRNPDSSEHGLIYNTSGFAGAIENDPDTVIAFEDFLGLGDRDYNDMVVGITNAVPLSGSNPHCTKQIPGDINGDCKVNLADFAVIVAHWLECNLDPQEACGQ